MDNFNFDFWGEIEVDCFKFNKKTDEKTNTIYAKIKVVIVGGQVEEVTDIENLSVMTRYDECIRTYVSPDKGSKDFSMCLFLIFNTLGVTDAIISEAWEVCKKQVFEDYQELE